MTTRTTLSVGVLLIAAAAIGALVSPEGPGAEPPALDQPGRRIGPRTRKSFRRSASASRRPRAMYDALKQQARGGKPLTWPQMAEPACDWSGVYSSQHTVVRISTRICR